MFFSLNHPCFLIPATKAICCKLPRTFARGRAILPMAIALPAGLVRALPAHPFCVSSRLFRSFWFNNTL